MKNKTQRTGKTLWALVLMVCMFLTLAPKPVSAAEDVDYIVLNYLHDIYYNDVPYTSGVTTDANAPYSIYNLADACTMANGYMSHYNGETIFPTDYINSLSPNAQIAWYKSLDSGKTWELMYPDEKVTTGPLYKGRLYLAMHGSANVTKQELPVKYHFGFEDKLIDFYHPAVYYHNTQIPDGGIVEIIFDDFYEDPKKELSVFGIDQISVPTAGQKPDFVSANLYSSSCSIYSSKNWWSFYYSWAQGHSDDYDKDRADAFLKTLGDNFQVTWYESNDNDENFHYMIDTKTGEIGTFRYGHSYRIELYIEIPEKYYLSDYAYAYINDPGNIAEMNICQTQIYRVNYTFTNLLAEPVEEVKLSSVPESVPGEKPDFTKVDLGSTSFKVDETAGMTIEESEDGTAWSAFADAKSADKEFQYDHYYKYSVLLNAEDGYVFTEDVKVSVNGNEAQTELQNEGKSLLVSVVYDPIEKPAAEELASVEIQGLVVPEADKVPDISKVSVPSSAPYTLVPGAVVYEVSDNANTYTPMASGAAFEAGKYYRAAISLELSTDYVLAENAKVTVNGEAAEYKATEKEDSIVIAVTYNFGKLEKAEESKEESSSEESSHPSTRSLAPIVWAGGGAVAAGGIGAGTILIRRRIRRK